MSPLERLEAQKRSFGAGQSAEVLRLIDRLEPRRILNPTDLARYHEALLFYRSYPASRAVVEATEAALARTADRVARLKDPTALEEPELSGIAGCTITAVFSAGVVRQLRARYPNLVTLATDAWDEPRRLAHVLPSLAPEYIDDGAVESDVPFCDWLNAAGGFPRLLEHEQLFDQLEAPVTFDYGATPASRTAMRMRNGPEFYHDTPLIPRRDVSLDRIEAAPPIPLRVLAPGAARRVIAAAIESSAVRYRELHGFTYGDPASVREYRVGRGVVFYLWDVVPRKRLPLRAYQALTMWKNGVPIGYFEGLSICDRMEAGFNLYYTFRDGETAWLYSRLLTVMHQAAGVRYFWLHPYQIGHDNEEAIASGAFWFYRKLGFRSVDPSIRALTAKEERTLARDPAHRTPPATLRKLVMRPMIYSLPSADPTAWDNFEARTVTLAAARAGSLGRAVRGFSEIAAAKITHRELDFLKLTQQHSRLRTELIRLGKS
jgi:hypothetical protein